MITCNYRNQADINAIPFGLHFHKLLFDRFLYKKTETYKLEISEIQSRQNFG